jgi:hypothetical protein
LDLSQKKVDELIRSIRNEEKTYVLFGKTQVYLGFPGPSTDAR